MRSIREALEAEPKPYGHGFRSSMFFDVYSDYPLFDWVSVLLGRWESRCGSPGSDPRYRRRHEQEQYQEAMNTYGDEMDQLNARRKNGHASAADVARIKYLERVLGWN